MATKEAEDQKNPFTVELDDVEYSVSVSKNPHGHAYSVGAPNGQQIEFGRVSRAGQMIRAGGSEEVLAPALRAAILQRAGFAQQAKLVLAEEKRIEREIETRVAEAEAQAEADAERLATEAKADKRSSRKKG